MFYKNINIIRFTVFLVGIFLGVLFLSLPSLSGAVTGNNTKLCLTCHQDFNAVLSSKIMHKPVAEGKCGACHNPHAASHENLLKDNVENLCFSCHKKTEQVVYKDNHQPFQQGDCLSCHDPHGSDFKNLLSGSGGNSCLNCHNTKDIMFGKKQHPEVAKSKCLTCHSAHGSSKAPLLKSEKIADVCLRCHTGEKTPKKKSHPGKNTNCLYCHSVHGSDKSSLQYDYLHQPYAKGECSVCHVSSDYKKVSKEASLCLKCHETVLETFNNASSHLVAGGEKGPCLSCHNAHGGNKKFLMNRFSGEACYSCHSDTKASLNESNYIHPRLSDCLQCHEGHSSPDRRFLKIEEGNTRLCDQCHSSQGTFTHPVGEEIIDPRTKQPVECYTCHNIMGAEEPFLLELDPKNVLCVQCHQM